MNLLAEQCAGISTNTKIKSTHIVTVRAAARPTSIAADMSFFNANRMASTRSGIPGAKDKIETAENEVVKPKRRSASGVASATCDNA